jgi:serine/threonine protein kinase
VRYQIGDQPVPGYRLEAFLGAGSYGEVWKAGGPGGVPCALKFISMDSKSGLKEFRSIRLVKRLQHPNLVPVQAIWLRDPDGNVLSDTGEDSISIRLMGPKELVIAMGLGQKSLAQRLEECRGKGGIPPRELLKYMDGAAKGIDYLNAPEHDLGDGPGGVIHCDIKPANLLIVGGGIQVCDYGVAKAMRKVEDAKKSMAAGTPAYAAPELINNEPGPHTDQYSLAITYYELRTGRLPFDEARALVANLMGQLDFSGVGLDEQEVLRQATHKQPAKRFESCEEFVEALKVAAQITFGPSGAVSVGQTRRVAAASPPQEPARTHPAPAAEPAQPQSARKSLSDLLQPGGELVPDHFLTKLLGRGGYGEVWEAGGPGGVRCALKVVRDLQGRGKHEFAVLDKIRELDHPCLVQLRGYWLLAPDGTRIPSHKVGLTGVPNPSAVVISTDLAEKNLLDRLKECKQDGHPGIPPEELVGYVRQAAVALDYLNIRHHIQHRDVKPENLLLRGDRLLVSDFGLAKLIEGDDGAVQSSSSGMTLEYAAPELLQKKVSARTDQYSLALTYYTLRTGRMPFPRGMGQFDTMQARIKGQLDLSGVTESERAVLSKALSPNPADRYASCEELARELALASGVGTGPIPALPPSGVIRRPDLMRSTPTDLSPRQTPHVPSAPAAHDSPTRSGLPHDTPRASSPPHDVPLTPAGTILFGHEPATGHESAEPRSSSAPWVVDAGPIRSTKSGKRGLAWNEDQPTGGGSGRIVAVIAGVAVLLALAAVGVYHLFPRNGDQTLPSGGGGELAQADQLTADVERFISREQFDDARRAITELDLIDKTRAETLRERLRVAERSKRVAELKDQIEQRITKNQFADVVDLLAQLDSLDHVAATVIRSRYIQARNARVAELEGQIKGLDRTKKDANLGRFQGWYDELAALDPGRAEEVRKWWDAPPMTEIKPQPDGRLASAREHFKAGKPADGLSVLEDILKTSRDDATRQTAMTLKSEWTKARAAGEVKGAGYPLVTEYRKLFPPPKVADLPEKADWDDLTMFRKRDLAEKIKAAVPGLDSQTDWKGLADACREAEPTEWVAACLAECWAELTLSKRSPDFRPPVLAGIDAGGYGRYADVARGLVAALANDPGQAADDAARLVNDELAARHDWANAYRFGRLARLLIDARVPYRIPDDAPIAEFSKPYPRRGEAERVVRWLHAARRAAGETGQAVRTGEIDYELTLAEGSKDERDRNRKEFARAAEAAADSDHLKEQDRLARARFWVFHARSRADRADELASLRKAFDLLQEPKTAREAQYAYKEVVWSLRYEVSREPGEGQDRARPEADLLAEVAQKLVKNQKAWANWKVLDNASANFVPVKEAVELLLLAHQAKVKAGNRERGQEYVNAAVELADRHPELPPATRGEAFGAAGWFGFDVGYKSGDEDDRKPAWRASRPLLAKALRLAPKHQKAWHWQFALGVATRFHWEWKVKEGDLSNAEKVELADDCALAAGLVRAAEYPAFQVYQQNSAGGNPDPLDKAVMEALFFKEKGRHNAACLKALEAAVNNKDLAKASGLPVWRLAIAELKFIGLEKGVVPADMKKELDRLAGEAEKALPPLKGDGPKADDLKALRRAAAEEMIARVRQYPVEK